MFKIIVPLLGAYLFKKFRILSAKDSKIFINYILYFALPFISFRTSYSIGLKPEVFKIACVAWIGILTMIGIGYISGKLLKLKSADLRTWLLVVSFGNTAFLGYPYNFTFFGEEGLNFAILYDTLGSFIIVITIGLFIATGKISLKVIFSFPAFWTLILGFLLRGQELPYFVKDVINFIYPSILPVIIFAIGLIFEFHQIYYNLNKAILALILKIFVMSFITYFIARIIGISGLPLKVAVLQASMPTMIFSTVLALKYDLNYHLTISCVSLGIILSLFTTSLIVYLTDFLLKIF